MVIGVLKCKIWQDRIFFIDLFLSVFIGVVLIAFRTIPVFNIAVLLRLRIDLYKML